MRNRHFANPGQGRERPGKWSGGPFQRAAYGSRVGKGPTKWEGPMEHKSDRSGY